MVAGAKAGIKQNGKAANASTPCEPVSIDSLVKINAVAEVAIMSRKPKVFQNQVNFLAYGLSFLIAFATNILVIAVVRSPTPASNAILEGSASKKPRIRKKAPISLKM